MGQADEETREVEEELHRPVDQSHRLERLKILLTENQRFIVSPPLVIMRIFFR